MYTTKTSMNKYPSDLDQVFPFLLSARFVAKNVYQLSYDLPTDSFLRFSFSRRIYLVLRRENNSIAIACPPQKYQPNHEKVRRSNYIDQLKRLIVINIFKQRFKRKSQCDWFHLPDPPIRGRGKTEREKKRKEFQNPTLT